MSSDSIAPPANAGPTAAWPQWIARDASLAFKLGTFQFRELRFRVAALATPFTQLPPNLGETNVTLGTLDGVDAAFIPEHPTGNDPAQIVRRDGLLRYISFSDVRYLVELAGPFEGYLKKFSAKRRHDFLRAVRKFEEFSGGTAECKLFTTPSEMLAFQQLAVAISDKTYKSEIGWTFPGSVEFSQELIQSAKVGTVRGYVLYSRQIPAAYVFCRVERDTVLYTHIAYDPHFGDYSPGTALLYKLLELLFAEQRFRYLDFMGGQYWRYKQFYSTLQIPTSTVWYFRDTLKYRALVRSHLVLRDVERLVVHWKKSISRAAD